MEEKTLIQTTRALCALLAATAAPAFAQASGATLYGIVDLGVRHASGLTPGYAPSADSRASLNSGVDNTSRWGLRGSEDLGGGAKALFHLEAGINADTGASANSSKFFDRASWLGLQGGWGTLAAGRQTTLLADAVSPVDPLGMRFASFNPNINVAALSQHGLGIQYGSAGSTSGSYRLDNALKYTGRFGAMTVRAMHGFGELAGGGSRLSSSGLGLAYAKQGLTLSGAYQTFKDANARDLDAYLLGAAYQWGSVRWAATAGRSQARTSATARTEQRVLSAGGTWSATPAADLTLAYYKVDRTRTLQAGDGYGRLVAFGEYKLSRRTRLYAEFDATRWRGGYQGTGNKARATGVTLGVLHHF
ncbi:porin [Alicycliphilus denitrificans]|uniref:porin n=1 Tax=Alicycliphilus denitrificans TaxID=179636 RepID=UPI00384AAF10